MERLNDINNYLIVENGTVKEYEFQQNIKVIDHHLTIYEDAKIQIIYLLTQPDQYCFDLTIQDHTKVDLIEMYEASCQCSFHKNLIVKDNSFVTRYVENGYYCHENIDVKETVEIYQDAHMNCAYVELANYSTLSQVQYRLLQEGADVHLRLASLSKEKETKQYQMTLEHLAPNTFGDMDNYGIVKSQAKLIIDGVGRITKGNYLSSTHQTNKIIVFDDGCVAQANPYLYIDEYDVKASHGASVGKIDEDHLYYLESRGLSKQDAMHLVTYGYFLPVLEFITVDSLKERFSQVLKDKVGL